MDLLIAILMCLGLHASHDELANPEFYDQHRAEVDRANVIIQNHWYLEREGGIVVDPAVSM